MNKSEVDKLLGEAKYNFAKTMPGIPHYYTLIRDWENKERFTEVVKFIRENGVEGSFYSRKFIYYFADGWKYWTMDDNPNDTILINREKQE